MKRSRTVVHNATKPPLEIKIAHLRDLDLNRRGTAPTGHRSRRIAESVADTRKKLGLDLVILNTFDPLGAAPARPRPRLEALNSASAMTIPVDKMPNSLE
jgi:hypothetical protein